MGKCHKRYIKIRLFESTFFCLCFPHQLNHYTPLTDLCVSAAIHSDNENFNVVGSHSGLPYSKQLLLCRSAFVSNAGMVRCVCVCVHLSHSNA